MANITTQKLGGTANYQVNGPIRYEVDIKTAVDGGLTSGDNIEVITLEAGTLLRAVDAEITEALVLGASNQIDFGTTEADPDEYVDAQTDTAVGRFTGYVAGNGGIDTVLAADTTFYIQVAGDGITSGKIAVLIDAVAPAKSAKPLATKTNYPN
jgi:hypothetical protein